MAQAKRHFHQESFRLLVFDFDLADEPIPRARERLLRKENQLPIEGELTPKQQEQLTRAWKTDRENRAFRKIRDLLPDGHAQYGSVSLLKDIIDREIRQITRIMTAIPALALLVAVLGVGNLMMANVNARARQIATLRAIGATKWQIIRLVVGEASVLALIGCVLGVGLGLHLAALSNYATAQMVGFEPVWAVPWNWVGYGVAFTSGMCLLAGIAPARRAARNDIISALAAN
jgi:predicted lysophospholipase L1 biosynthesis ABC-type transport system permease subunit